MKVKDIKAALAEANDEWEILFRYSVPPNCNCSANGNNCYCGYDDVTENFSISYEMEYDKKTKTHKTVGIEFTAN